ncbi:hypothetical protein V1506DRAFT_531532 [Lipomyces tetrasporus]
MYQSEVAAYKCRCAEFILAITPPLSNLPHRDPNICGVPSLVIPRKDAQCVFSMRAERDRKSIHLTRKDGKFERWFLYRCPRCNLAVAYDTSDKDAAYTYILESALLKMDVD